MRGLLTRRQREFLARFVAIYQEAGEPVHYAEVARRLGLGRVTAYEMLRLLEARGLVRSQFHRPRERRGPGRAKVLFAPTQEAHRVLEGKALLPRAWSEEDWEAIRTQVLARLQSFKASLDYEQVLDEWLARLAEVRRPLQYMAEAIATMLLVVHTLLEGPYGRQARERLQRIGLPGEMNLSVLPGMAVALSLAERVNRRVVPRLLQESARFQRMLEDLSREHQRRLAAFAREVLTLLYARTQA